jgi:methyl-accepting chemotaxis protein
MKIMQNIKVFQKIIILGVVIILTFGLLLALYIYPTYENNMYAAKEEQTRNMTDSAAASIMHFVELEQSGTLTRIEAQNAAMEVVRYMRYDDGNYFWINDLNYKFIMHPNVSVEDNPEWYVDNGLVDYVDPTGKHIFTEFIDVATTLGEGRVDYQWPKSGKTGDPADPKIAYVKLVPEWDWVVGTGIYVDDVQKQINETLMIALLVILAIVVFSVVIAVALANSIAKPLASITAVAGRLAQGDISDDVKMERKTTVGLLAGAFASTIQYQRGMSDVADRMADGDLTAEIQAKSEKVRLGNSFANMLASLRDAVGQVSQTALALDTAAEQLSLAANQAAQAPGQIATTIQQIASGTPNRPTPSTRPPTPWPNVSGH